jgi:hypothetical protein
MTTVDVVVKMKVELPDTWEPVGRRWQHPFRTWVENLTYSLFDRRPPEERVWEDRDGEQWNVLHQAEVVDVEVDAGEWGFDCVDKDSDDRLGVFIVVVER